ncbi:MAG: DUF973 family protein [Thermoplasmatales archaeon]|nr:DUF973 family protein [Thermoplasmatales archaeon]
MSQNEVLGASPNTKTEHDALENIRLFSLLSIVGFVIDAAIAVISVFYITSLLSSLLQTSAVSPSLLGFDVAIIVMGVVAAILLLLSFVFLRRGYRTLKGISTAFSSPYTGVNLFFIGLVLVVVGAIVFIPIALLHVSLAHIAIGMIVVVLIGAVMSFVGEILALIVGSFRLKTQFNNSTYGTAGIMFIIGIFIPFLPMVGAILLYTATNSQLKKEPRIQKNLAQ